MIKISTYFKNPPLLLTLILLFLGSIDGFAQQESITGKVTDVSGQPLPGVNVLIKNTFTGTTTDLDGVYKITNKEGFSQNDVLVFSFIGHKTFEGPVNGSSVVDVALEEDKKVLDEVVVTALGIKREEKSLGYAAQSIDAKAIQENRSNNWVTSLSGKVAGLNVVGTGSGPIGSSRITLRGESSLNLDNNQALIVVDGVPISSKVTGTGHSAYLSADSPVDFGSAVSDLNPDDIEKITVLKGPAATALYGSRAANGALIITTKSGSRNEKGLGVSFNSDISVTKTGLRWPDYQFEYGEGRTDEYYSYLDSDDGKNTSTNVSAGRAWGPKFEGQMYYQYNPNSPDGKPTERTPWRPYKGYISDFFETGVTFTNNIAIDGSNDRSSARLSLSHLKNEWIVPNTGFERINAAISLNHKISEKLRLTAKANYANKRSDNLPMAGYNNQSIMYFMILGTTPNVDINWFKPYWQEGMENVEQKSPFNPGPDNVYLQVYEMLNKINKHGIIGNISATYDFSHKLGLTVRSGIDLAHEERSQQRPYSMTRYPKGMFRQQNVFNYEINNDVLLTYRSNIGSKINYSISAGANSMKQLYNFSGMYADQLAMPGIYMISNSLDQAVADPDRYEKSINSVYVASQFDYEGKVFLDVTGRNDWSSTLPKENNSFFYPSVSTSYILNEIFAMPRAVSFSKLRLSWAQVGNDTRPYQTSKYYDKIYSNNFTNPSTLFNGDLKPEITSSIEAGFDLRLFNNRLGIDAAVYRNNSRNQILEIPLDNTSGYSRVLMNAGLITSKGVELVITGKPVQSQNFNWNSTLTWSRNRSYVKELAEGIENQIIANHGSNVSIEARVGGLMGDMYGRGFQRSPDGQVIYTSAGIPAELDPTIRKFGNAFADWKAGILNELSYKNFKLSFLFDGQLGGSVFSQTNHKLNTLGKTKVTLPGREGGLVGDGVVLQGDGTYAPNTTEVSAQRYYDEYYKLSNTETNIFDASFIKLRETRIEYNLPVSFISRLSLQRASIALYGRDLLLFTKFPAFDPEAANMNSGTIVPGIEITQFPSTRTMGLNLNIKF
ncbi:MAG: SusC/RagA family TonB-linked outer membrane protein [Bacteroidota bacterium]|nr:SusC/RagA family TonB-linked outer membrane protein [Bacteroidota bacterium]